MSGEGKQDYYEVLQVSANAEPDTIHRVYRLLAQRFHPDNQESGDSDRFHEIHEAYTVLSDPERRAKYDVVYHKVARTAGASCRVASNAEDDFEMEQIGRLTLLEALYTRRRMEPTMPSLMTSDLETLIGRPREHLDFTIWYLAQRKFVTRDDQARLQITADGVDYLEQNYRANLAAAAADGRRQRVGGVRPGSDGQTTRFDPGLTPSKYQENDFGISKPFRYSRVSRASAFLSSTNFSALPSNVSP